MSPAAVSAGREGVVQSQTGQQLQVTNLLTTWMGHQQRLLLSRRAWLRAVNCSCFLKARRVSKPCRLSLKLPKMGDKARLSRRFSSRDVAM